MPALSTPDPRFRASFAAAMDEFAAEGRGGPDDHSAIGRYRREQRLGFSAERNGGVLEDERAGKLRFWVPTG